jgi:glycerol-3-phosphate dehydrogenase
MAKQVVDRIVSRSGADSPCRTGEILLGMEASDEDLTADFELPDGTKELFAFRYGHAGRNVLAVAADAPTLAAPLVEGMPDLAAEVVVAARYEQARSVGDVLLRRTRLGLLAAPQLRDGLVAGRVAELLGSELGWDAKRIAAEAEAWPGVAKAEGTDPAGEVA